MTYATSSLPISFEEFRQLIARELQIDVEKVVETAAFVEDLQADSIRLVELILRLEDQGIQIPLEAAWEIRTVGDAYRLYRDYAAGTRLVPAT